MNQSDASRRTRMNGGKRKSLPGTGSDHSGSGERENDPIHRILTSASFPPFQPADREKWLEQFRFITSLAQWAVVGKKAPDRSILVQMKRHAIALEKLCNDAVAAGFTDSTPAYLVGPIRLLAEWSDTTYRKTAPSRLSGENSKGRPRKHGSDMFLGAMIEQFEDAFDLPATPNDGGLFAKFVRIALREFQGVELPRDWIRKHWEAGKKRALSKFNSENS
ncbi:hypothetical protein [Acidiphilium sp.]|uniref:hypothetical protein n=1 Tax=Acidiphilium sp. TaxID=527 RepID=UPI0025886D2D|nr:hypothetical protein [Acidiphilium sp.]